MSKGDLDKDAPYLYKEPRSDVKSDDSYVDEGDGNDELKDKQAFEEKLETVFQSKTVKQLRKDFNAMTVGE